jgi:hypothetical protein
MLDLCPIPALQLELSTVPHVYVYVYGDKMATKGKPSQQQAKESGVPNEVSAISHSPEE